MPTKNALKTYLCDSFYHVYNRGVEKRKIFLDEQDYLVFLHLLKFYLSPSDKENTHPPIEITGYKVTRPRPLTNLEKEVELLAFCLMPNHFHLMIKQKTIDGMPKLLKKIATTYSMYFNKRYDRVGHLFQGRYKASLITKDNYLLHLSRYIHLNPTELTRTVPVNHPYSSYQYYLGRKRARWVKPDFILKFFEHPNKLEFIQKFQTYKDFVEKYKGDTKEILGNLALED
jgi:putative transposase